MAKVAVIGKIVMIEAIKDADRIKLATVVCGDAGRWSGVVGLDHHIGELVTVFLQDALLPPSDRWAFMEKHKWRVRMARFKGVPSECVIVKGAPDMPIGTDLAEALGVTKYYKPLPASMSGDAVGNFPSFIPKTDEPNFQTVPEFVERLATESWVVSLKCDGSSCTAWNDEDGNLHVASRNLELREFNKAGAGNSYWIVARKYDFTKLPKGMALQFEVVGPGIQSNPVGLKDIDGRAFTLYDYENRKTLGWLDLSKALQAIGMPMALILGFYSCRACSSDELRQLAEVRYQEFEGQKSVPGEGIVIRAADGSWSMKVINLLYKN